MSLVPSTRKTTYRHDPLAVDPWDTFHHLGAPFRPPVPPRPHFTAETAAKIEWTQTPAAHFFKLHLPGVKREEVTVDLEEDRVLKVTSEKCVEKEDKSDWWHRVERSRGRFMTSFVLPENCKPHETEACMENGVLTIKVPKLEVRNGHGGSARIPVR